MKKRSIKELEEAIKDIGFSDDLGTIQKVISCILLEILKELRKEKD